MGLVPKPVAVASVDDFIYIYIPVQTQTPVIVKHQTVPEAHGTVHTEKTPEISLYQAWCRVIMGVQTFKLTIRDFQTKKKQVLAGNHGIPESLFQLKKKARILYRQVKNDDISGEEAARRDDLLIM